MTPLSDAGFHITVTDGTYYGEVKIGNYVYRVETTTSKALMKAVEAALE